MNIVLVSQVLSLGDSCPKAEPGTTSWPGTGPSLPATPTCSSCESLLRCGYTLKGTNENQKCNKTSFREALYCIPEFLRDNWGSAVRSMFYFPRIFRFFRHFDQQVRMFLVSSSLMSRCLFTIRDCLKTFCSRISKINAFRALSRPVAWQQPL